jgi:hypothetical protein
MGSGYRDGNVAPILHDLTGDRAPDAAAVIHCSAGGVSWPDTVVFYGPKTSLLGWVDMSNPHPAEHAGVRKMSVEGRDVRVNWGTTEGCCLDPQEWTARIHWNGSKVRIVGARRLG